jgi:hypothetical protein
MGRSQPVTVALLFACVACGSETASDRKAAGGAGAGATAGSSATSAGSGGSSTTSSGGALIAGGGGAISGGVGGASGAGDMTGGSAGMVVSGTGGGAGANAGGSAGAGSGRFEIHVELASDVKPTAPTTVGIVTWALDRPGITEAHIDFGLDTAYGMTAPVDLTRENYRTVLVGMKPERTYHYRIVASDGSAAYPSDDRTLTTGALPIELPIREFSVPFPDRVDKGFFIGSFWSLMVGEPWTVFILDTDGDVVWWFTDRPETFSGELGFSRARLSADSEDVWLARVFNGAAPLRRVSIDTLDVGTYPDTRASHDICAVEGDTMAYLDYGENDCDSIFEIDKAGTIKEVFEGADVKDPEDIGCHANSVRYSKKEDVYVFSDHQNDVFVVARDGSVQWRLSERVSGGSAGWGGFQHGTQLLDESLLIFANEGIGDVGSQALEFALDGSLKKSFASRADIRFLGDVQRMPNGNTLIDYGYLMQVVDANDAVVLEIQSSTEAFGYVEFRQSLYGLPLDIQQ